MVKIEQGLARALNPEAINAQLESVERIFEQGLAAVLSGEVDEAVLFEGDFILALGKDKATMVDIGNGLAFDSLVLAARFEELLGQKGTIVLRQFDSIDNNKSEELLTNNSQALDYLRAKMPGAEFVTEKTTYFVNTKDSQLMAFSNKTSLAGKQIPLSWSFVAKMNQAVSYDLFR